ncbi:hypothetical protein D3C78_1365600 [compost metagenome]
MLGGSLSGFLVKRLLLGICLGGVQFGCSGRWSNLGLGDIGVHLRSRLALGRLRAKVRVALGVYPFVDLAGRGSSAQGEQQAARENHATHVVSFYWLRNLVATITKTRQTSSCAASQLSDEVSVRDNLT